MALDILTQDIVLDETTGFTDDDINPAIPPYDTNPTVQYLLSLDDPGGLTSPEVAFQANFVVASASAGETITSVVLSQNLTGTPFSTTVGVNSGIQTVDGNYVWLFKDADPPHANVVIGVIGTSDPSAAPAATGPLAFSFGLVSTSATNADLYTVEYVPLLNPDATNPDDRIGLTNKVFASVTGTSVASFLGSAAAPGNNDFYLINSANDASKQLLVIGLNGGSANVSEQGFGINNQSINPNETLQVDFVTGGTLNAGSASQIQYGNHIETITQAGFTISQITPSTPTARVDVTVSAFNNTGNDQGTNFFDGTTTSPVDITGIKLTGTSGFASVITVDGTYATGSGNITVTGLSGTGNAVTITGLDNTTTVDITTGSPMDRLTVKGVDANEGCDISEFHFSATSTNAYSEEVGSHINFDDDGPSISTTGAEPTLTVDESVLTTNDTQSFAANFSSGFGADGAGTLTYALGVVAGPSGLIDTATGQAVILSLNGSVVEGHTIGSNDLVFTVSVSAAGAVTLDQLRAVVHADASNPDDSTSLAADNLVTLTATVTDKDGDHLSASLDIGQNLNFKDDGPSISTTGTEPTLTVDESVLTTNDTQSFAANFSSGFGADGAGTLTYALGVVAGPSGLIDTATGQAVVLSLNGSVVEGHTIGSNDLVFTVSVSAAGAVTLDQLRAVVHADASNPDDSTSLAADNLVTLTATVTDKDGDHLSASLDIGQNLNFKDDGPSISTTGTEPTLTVDESNLGANSADFATVFTPNAGADSDAISYALGINQVTNVSGLTDTLTGLSVLLFVEGGEVVGRAGSAAGDIVFTVSVAVDGTVTLDQARAVIHSPDTGPDQQTSLAADDLVTLTAIITDGDGDQASDSVNIGTSLVFKDDAPTITVPFDGDQNAGNGIGTPETLANTLNASATGAFGYDIGADAHPAAFYASGSDFVDQNGALAGVQIGLTGTITGGGGGNILTSEVTLASESLTSATFNFTFTYDKDPAAGTQTGTAGGTLVFDKIADTYTIHLTDPLEGFSFDVIHTSQLLSKEPLGNTGHPQIVLEKLQADDPNTPANENFYVQFTGNLINKANPFSLTANGEGSSGDATFTLGGHEMVSNANESWVSATQSTNGVAGDTIQKGELLTLRFFDSNVGINSQNEATQPTATAGTMAIKFDGIGNSEDLMLILNLIDDKGTASTLDDVSITRAMYVQNADIFKMGHVPAPYSGEFTLDNNDGLVIIEQNDYNAAGEHFVLQGVQIMQSGNGITGNNTAINLNPTTGAGGGSDATTNLVNFDPTDNDVLKITDIGFTSTSTQTPDAHLDFAFKVADADADQTAMQHILVDVA
ncbi:hypothetical protein EN884_11815 [Mesorhizobium sp. M7A.F.Ca.AU.001.01.1.1]|uniref:DUF5801 repeats-in-toxin domain-containing protein n=3 Tax=Mesorhizobium TaxID=68287 RepID=UPI000FD5230A|nr:DUF5801 repeats-in-toxin domain-containing protein [Mesorhizobium sp. M7A.F.Ca.AU.001.01.1.1]RVC16682.1 hypothetical protein EN884_11815 [Mesorhizobium sp. M7A.F.Ca.AU.001.01.1.1]